MGVRYLGFVVLIWLPGALHAQSAAQPCPPPSLDGGYFVPEQESYDHESEIVFVCDKGSKPAVEGWWATSTCQGGTWLPEPQCIDESACYPLEVPNGKYKESQNRWHEQEAKIRIKCDKGYELKNRDATAICLNGTWSSVPICEMSDSTCNMPPPQIPHAVIIGQNYQEVFAADSEVHYECENGYTAEGSEDKKIICLSGRWTEGPACNESACYPLEVPNGKYKENQNRWHEQQTKIRITCDKGYELKNRDATTICLNGTWSSVPICEMSDSTCNRPPPQIPHAVIIGQNYQEVFAADSEVHYECENGYTAEGSEDKKIICLSGRWTEGPACRRTSTGRTPVGGGAQVLHSLQLVNCTSDVFSYFLLERETRPNTGHDGSTAGGTNERRTTEVDQCGQIPSVANGDVERQGGNYLRYQCGSFYTLVGPEQVRCFNNRSWSELPTCREASCAFTPDLYSRIGIKEQGTIYVKEGEMKTVSCEWPNSSKFHCTAESRRVYTHCKYIDGATPITNKTRQSIGLTTSFEETSIGKNQA
ncbi:complement factor H-like isoform X1 [Xyrichtys novacula]|uniref:Complement factor H-like isoform X1 n=1 Tax=Xyrichtys novacula TaxID=13765 RepID=A0AAV1GF53_XYRNO|nr:complement factor H-like isoform X1 [Xyrichtys novacula]